MKPKESTAHTAQRIAEGGRMCQIPLQRQKPSDPPGVGDKIRLANGQVFSVRKVKPNGDMVISPEAIPKARP